MVCADVRWWFVISWIQSATAALGLVKTYLPGSVFMDCSAKKWPMNTLFPDIDGSNVNFEDLKRYKSLVLALYEVSPMGSLSRLDPYRVQYHVLRNSDGFEVDDRPRHML